MTHLFVPYILAVIAKLEGFNEPCIAEYYKEKLYFHNQTGMDEHGCGGDELNTYTNTETNFTDVMNTCSAPLYSQIIDWFRDKYKIEIAQDLRIHKYGFYYSKNFQQPRELSVGEDYYDALNKAIEEAFKLI